MKKVFVVFLLSIAYVSSFSQTLSKEETVEYIKTKLTKSANHFVKCRNDGAKLVENIIDVKCADSKLFITIDHNVAAIDANLSKFELVDFVLILGKDYVATPISDCSNVFEIGKIEFSISKEDAESLVKAINYLSKLCVDPFK